MKKRNLFPMVCMSALLAAGSLWGNAAQIKAAETDAAYDAVFKLPQESILSVSNNGGKYGSSDLSYLTDGDVKTHWETGKANSSSFTNEVVFTFDDSVELGSMVYYPRVTGKAYKGFPTKYSIYSSESKDGDDFKLAASGGAVVKAGATRLEFEPTRFRRLKFVFDEARQNWASGGEMLFYYPDLLPAKAENLFTDGTMTALQPEYQDARLLAEMLEQAKGHPDASLVQRVQRAIDIQNGTLDFAGAVFSAEQRGDGAAFSKQVLRTGGYGSNFLPTGYAALAGDQVKIYVDVEKGAPLPSVVFTQQVGRWSNWQRSYPLQQGENTFTVPTIYDEAWKTKVIPGGAIYILNPYTIEEQGAAPKIFIEGAQRYPIFRDGDDQEAFLEALGAYKEKLEANPDTTVDIVELYSDKFIFNGNMQAAATFLSGETSPQAMVDFHNLSQDRLLEFAGIDGRAKVHSRGGARVNIRLMQPYGAAYAISGHVGLQQGSANYFFKGTGTGWLYNHEVGHLLDTREGYYGEITNNMWANHIQVDINNGYDRVNYTNLFTQQASDDYRELVENGNQLAMYWQLQLLNENYWPRYQSAYRENLLKDAGLTKNERMAVISCYAVGMDVIEHFERYKFVERNEKIDQALVSLEITRAPENCKPWYLWTKAAKDRTSAFDREYQPEIVGVSKNGSQFTITAAIDASASQALLGYEVMEDGKVLGFTSGDSFTGIYTDDGQTHTYTMRAYDLRLNASAVSLGKEVNFREPSILVEGSTLIPLGAEFEPLDLVRAESYDGTDLTQAIQVVQNTVETSSRGSYEVVYEVTDREGHSSQLAVEVAVVSTFTYLSDMEEISASVGNGSFRKDQSIQGGIITLLQNQAPVTFEKGLGTHAPSSVIYDLEGKYSYFEAYVGIDQAMAASRASNAKFRVVADGTVIYESEAMKASTDAEYVRLNIAGVDTLELVTDSNGANSNDHTVWGGARVAATNCEPVLHARNAAFLDSQSADLSRIVSEVTAEDAEDGDLTGSITYETDFQEGKTGSFDIVYSVADSDGNVATAARKIVVVNDFLYASDTDWKSAKVGWGQIQKDLSLTGSVIRLAGEEGIRTYEKGIGVHAHSEVVYDLRDKGYSYFTSDAGVDETAGRSNSSVTFQIYVDGVLVEDTPVMRKGTPAVQFCVDISNASELKLVVTNGGNGKGSDHANWADAKFLTAVKEADKEALVQLIAQAGERKEEEYTQETWAVLAEALARAQEIYDRANASQEETDQEAASLQEALGQLKLNLDTEELESRLGFAEKISGLEYVDPQMTHREERLESLRIVVAEYRLLLENGSSQEKIDQAAAALNYFIEETGQMYQPGEEPVVFTETAEETEEI